MSEKRNSLRSISPKCAGVLAIALLATVGPAAAQEPVGTASTDQDELFEESKQGSATYVVVFRLFADLVPRSSIGARVADIVVIDDNGRFGLPPGFEVDLLLGGDNEMIYACMNPAGQIRIVEPDEPAAIDITVLGGNWLTPSTGYTRFLPEPSGQQRRVYEQRYYE